MALNAARFLCPALCPDAISGTFSTAKDYLGAMDLSVSPLPEYISG